MALEAGKPARDWGPAVFGTVFVLALGLRLVLLGQHAFHMDEALYASWSHRIVHGDLLLTGGLRNDKPPLQMYLGALGLALFGECESSIRMMDALVSALECGLLAWALIPLAGAAPALGAGLLLAVSPLHRGYGASGVMDGPLSFFLLQSFVLAARGLAGWSGLVWGLAFCSKQTALFLAPWPLLALVVAKPGWRDSLKHWLFGSGVVCAALMLWELIFAHPRLGAFLGMAANQPEVGFKLAGFGVRLDRWMQLSAADLPWAPALALIALAGPPLGLGLFLKGRDGHAKAWALSLAFPLYAMAVFAAFNMRFFDRYAVPYAWALCASPAVLISAWAPGSRSRRVLGGLFLALAVLVMVWARRQPLSLEQQGAAGDRYDGYRALLLDLGQREPAGGALVTSQGGIRQMGAWYLAPGWSLAEAPDLPSAPGLPLYAAECEGSPPPAGKAWTALKRYDAFGPPPAWILYKAAP